MTKSSLPRPVIKWAGGKRQLLGELAERSPQDFENYFEPFFGGGALYLYLCRTGAMQGKAFLNDANPELINVYRMIRDRTAELVDAVQQQEFANTREAYLACQTRFNAIRGTDACVERAALSEGDFADVLPEISGGDFVYLDPPYLPISETANFTSYTTGMFGMAEQERLLAMFREADRRGAQVMLSNSVAPKILEMYAEFSVERVQVLRYINAKVSGRRGAEEIIVRNY